MTVIHDYEVKVESKKTITATIAELQQDNDLGNPARLGAAGVDALSGMIISKRAGDLKVILDVAPGNVYKCLVTHTTTAPFEGGPVYYLDGGIDGNGALLTTLAASGDLFGFIVVETTDVLPTIVSTEAGQLDICLAGHG